MFTRVLERNEVLSILACAITNFLLNFASMINMSSPSVSSPASIIPSSLIDIIWIALIVSSLGLVVAHLIFLFIVWINRHRLRRRGLLIALLKVNLLSVVRGSKCATWRIIGLSSMLASLRLVLDGSMAVRLSTVIVELHMAATSTSAWLPLIKSLVFFKVSLIFGVTWWELLLLKILWLRWSRLLVTNILLRVSVARVFLMIRVFVVYWLVIMSFRSHVYVFRSLLVVKTVDRASLLIV